MITEVEQKALSITKLVKLTSEEVEILSYPNSPFVCPNEDCPSRKIIHSGTYGEKCTFQTNCEHYAGLLDEEVKWRRKKEFSDWLKQRKMAIDFKTIADRDAFLYFLDRTGITGWKCMNAYRIYPNVLPTTKKCYGMSMSECSNPPTLKLLVSTRSGHDGHRGRKAVRYYCFPCFESTIMKWINKQLDIVHQAIMDTVPFSEDVPENRITKKGFCPMCGNTSF